MNGRFPIVAILYLTIKTTTPTCLLSSFNHLSRQPLSYPEHAMYYCELPLATPGCYRLAQLSSRRLLNDEHSNDDFASQRGQPPLTSFHNHPARLTLLFEVPSFDQVLFSLESPEMSDIFPFHHASSPSLLVAGCLCV